MLQVLKNLQTYLMEEEEKMVKADAECKSRTELLEPEAGHTNPARRLPIRHKHAFS